MTTTASSVQRIAYRKIVILGVLLGVGIGCRMGKAAEEGVVAPKTFGSTAPQTVKAELIAEQASIQPGGTTRIGVSFDIEPGWHIYAKDPGDAGLPTTIAWSGPQNVQFGPLEWPTPEQFTDPGDIHTRGYTGAVVLSSTMRLLEKGAGATVPIHAQVKWLACKDICVPGHTELSFVLPVMATPPAASTHSELFEHTN